MEQPAKPQIDKFKDAARELGCDDDQRFKERVRKLAGQSRRLINLGNKGPQEPYTPQLLLRPRLSATQANRGDQIR